MDGGDDHGPLRSLDRVARLDLQVREVQEEMNFVCNGHTGQSQHLYMNVAFFTFNFKTYVSLA